MHTLHDTTGTTSVREAVHTSSSRWIREKWISPGQLPLNTQIDSRFMPPLQESGHQRVEVYHSHVLWQAFREIS
jgi:hypothetical protein